MCKILSGFSIKYQANCTVMAAIAYQLIPAFDNKLIFVLVILILCGRSNAHFVINEKREKEKNTH